ncbi:histidinol-phosphate aminotransferase [Candidatus Termititenax persephonae]|uniref:Histidinol-phosphate aminotransferase n=1 Tax=Candidatus Termititenax persephonae TaxID=2218525 RepID=A0A388TFU1_9BACT|nr:histidinol-phosphate aminotransferase [Candidatus Termititenax persephonae]
MQTKANIQSIAPYQPGVWKEGAVKLASNENPLGSAPQALAAVQAKLSALNLYPDGGCARLRAALAEHYGKTPEYFLPGNGSDEIFHFITAAFVRPGEQVLTSTVTFSEYTFAARLFAGTVEYAPLADGKFQLAEIAKRVTPQTRVVFLANPNNPTGTYFTAAEFADFLRQIPEEVMVVSDEAYAEYVTAADYPDSLGLLERHKNLLITRTFSKIYGLAGLRVGYVMANPEVIAYLNKTREPFNVNALAQTAAAAALGDQEFVQKSRVNNEAGKKYLYAEFTRLGLKYFPTEANFIFVYIGQDCVAAFQKLMDKGVTVRPLKSFGISDALRVTIGTPEQNQKFIAALQEIL